MNNDELGEQEERGDGKIENSLSLYHVSFDDPPKLAKDAKTEEGALAHYRRVRDEIRKFIETLPQAFI